LSLAPYPYATHQLAAGLGVERLQRLMGHANIQTTLRYVHWLPSASEGEGALIIIPPKTERFAW
jgi:integrase